MKRFYTKTGIYFLFIILLFVNFFIIFIYKITEKKFYLSLAQIIGTSSSIDDSINSENNTSDNQDKSIEKILLSSLKTKDKTKEDKGKEILRKHGYIKSFIIFKNKVYDLLLLCGLSSIITIALFLIYNRYQSKKLKKEIINSIRKKKMSFLYWRIQYIRALFF